MPKLSTASWGGGGAMTTLRVVFLGDTHIPGVGLSFGVDRLHEVMQEHASFSSTNNRVPPNISRPSWAEWIRH